MSEATERGGESAVARRRNRRKKRGRRSYPLQIGLAALGLFGTVWMLAIFVMWLVRPVARGNEYGRDVVVMRERLTQQKKVNANLRQRVAYLRTDEGAERLARKKGFHRKGEFVYLLPPSPDDQSDAWTR